MKGKLLLGLALTSFIGANAFALEIKNGKLLSHKVWTTGNIKALPTKKISKEEVLKLNDKLKINNIAMNDHVTYTYSVIFSTMGTEGERTPVNGLQLAHVENGSDGTLTFLILNSLCAQTSDKTTECMFYQDEVQLDAQGYATTYEAAMIEPIFTQEGSYATEVRTQVAKLEDSGFFMIESGSSSAGYATITSAGKKSKA